MRLILKNSDKDPIKTLTFKKFKLYQNFISELNITKKPSEASLFTSNEKVTSPELKELKLNLKKLNIKLSHIYSNNRETVVSGKSLKINSTLLNCNEKKKIFFIKEQFDQGIEYLQMVILL